MKKFLNYKENKKARTELSWLFVSCLSRRYYSPIEAPSVITHDFKL